MINKYIILYLHIILHFNNLIFHTKGNVLHNIFIDITKNNTYDDHMIDSYYKTNLTFNFNKTKIIKIDIENFKIISSTEFPVNVNLLNYTNRKINTVYYTINNIPKLSNKTRSTAYFIYKPELNESIYNNHYTFTLGNKKLKYNNLLGESKRHIFESIKERQFHEKSEIIIEPNEQINFILNQMYYMFLFEIKYKIYIINDETSFTDIRVLKEKIHLNTFMDLKYIITKCKPKFGNYTNQTNVGLESSNTTIKKNCKNYSIKNVSKNILLKL